MGIRLKRGSNLARDPSAAITKLRDRLRLRHVRFTSESGQTADDPVCPLSADFVAEVAEERGPLRLSVE